MAKKTPKAPRHYIRQWRQHRSLTQVQLAERLEITQGHLSKVENGGRDYDQAFLERAAEELRCTPADLIMRDPTDPEGLWSIFDQLKPVERTQAVNVLKAIRGTGTGG